MINLKKSYKKPDLVFVAVILTIAFGFIFLMSIALPYGWREECVGNNCGFFFADRYRARDELWHMAMSQVSFTSYPFKMPIFAGNTLQAYHFLFALFLFLITKLGIGVLFSFYVIVPILWFVSYTFLTIKIARTIFPDRLATPIFLFFAYFSSNLAFVLSLKNHRLFWNDIGYFSNQPGEYMINPTLAFSILIFQVVIFLMLNKNLSMKRIALILVMAFLLWGTKFYGAIIGVFFIGLGMLLKVAEKKISWIKFILICFGLGLVSLFAVILFYNPFGTSNSGSVFAYAPLKTVHAMIEEPELWQMRRVALARYYLYSVDKLFQPKLWAIEIGTLCLYLIFSLSTRFFSLGIFFEKTKNRAFYYSIFAASLLSIFLATFFVQNGTDWFNTIQFLAFGQFLLQIPLASFVYLILKKGGPVRVSICTLIFVVTFLGSLNPLAKYGRHLQIIANAIPYERPQAKVFISAAEKSALSFLSRQSGDVVFTLPFVKIANDSTISELWMSNDTSYLPALSGKQAYIANIEQLELMFIDFKERQKIAGNPKELIKVDGIDYYYLLKEHPSYGDFVGDVGSVSNIIYENEDVEIYKRSRRTVTQK